MSGAKRENSGLASYLLGTAGSTDYRAAGDAARDRGDWRKAREAYTAYLQTRQDDFAIWIQLGHAEKELGDLSASEAAYSKGLALIPDDADAHLQLGHNLKLQARYADALRSYRKSYSISPTKAAMEEIKALGGTVSDEVTRRREKRAGPIFMYEIRDLFGYLRAHQTLSGIQRVQAALILSLMSELVDTVAFIAPSDASGRVWSFAPDRLARLIIYVTGSNIDHSELRLLIDGCEEGALLIEVQPGDTVFVLGSFWGHGVSPADYLDLKECGAVIGVYIYDIIPITTPEYCDEKLAHEFFMSFSEMMYVADFFLTISEHTRQEVLSFQALHELAPKPVVSVPLAHDIRIDDFHGQPARGARATDKQNGLSSIIHEVLREDYVLYVSTIERRKNHIYLARIWRNFIRARKAAPKLVFVGRRGWLVDEFFELIDRDPLLSSRIVLLHDVDDAQLELLYKNCLFTVFPSIVEGWGLPIGESLRFSKPCVASSTSSMPEVGGKFVDYINPFDLQQGEEVIRKLIEDDIYRREREMLIQSEFRPRSWAEVSAQLAEAVKKIASSTIKKAPYLPIAESGRVVYIGAHSFGSVMPEDYPKLVSRLSFFRSFYAAEKMGSWMKSAQGQIKIQTGLAVGTTVVVYCGIFAAPWAINCEFIVSASENRQFISTSIQDEVAIDLRVVGEVDENGFITLKVRMANTPRMPENREDTRNFFIGVKYYAFSPLDDPLSRLNVLEELRFDRPKFIGGRSS